MGRIATQTKKKVVVCGVVAFELSLVVAVSVVVYMILCMCVRATSDVLVRCE